MANITKKFKDFFDIRKLKYLYPNKNTTELELIQIHFCRTTIYYIHYLQGKIKQCYERNNLNITPFVNLALNGLRRERRENTRSEYDMFYMYFIYEITKYKRMQEENDDDSYVFLSFINKLLEYLYTRYNNN